MLPADDRVRLQHMLDASTDDLPPLMAALENLLSAGQKTGERELNEG
jgi:hypothetical protein